jgi:uncharacterized protein YjlB
VQRTLQVHRTVGLFSEQVNQMGNALEYLIQQPHIIPFLFHDDGAIPNNPTLPLLVYTSALRLIGDDPAAVAERIFSANGWGGLWRDGIYPFHHYHSTAHEVLAICRGGARVQFGGEQGVILDVQPGDVAVIPAGVGHKNLGATGDLLVVGAYPPGQQWDLCYGRPDERPRVIENIARVPLPPTDPVYGKAGLLLEHWDG